MLAALRGDIAAVRERDPAARGALEIVLAYPGLHAIWVHRLSHWLWGRGAKLPARVLSTLGRAVTAVEIHPAARLGPGLFIDHGAGVVIGETAEVGADVTLFHGVTLGGTTMSHGKRHPTIGDRVTIGAGAKVLGPVVIGDGSRVGANAVVVKDVPANAVVVGVPGQVIARSRPRPVGTPVDVDDAVLPDLVGVTLQDLLTRVDGLEASVSGAPGPAEPRTTGDGVWRGEDFSI